MVNEPMKRLRRSVLAAPGSSDRMIERAAACGADEVFLDLEDACAPREKVASRRRIVEALNGLDFGTKIRVVRINDVRTPLAYRDIVDVVEGAGARLDCVMVPKVRSAEEIRFVDRLLTQIEDAMGFGRRLGIEAQIEDGQGLRNVHEIAAASPRVETLVFGPGDFAASVGIPMLSIGAHMAGYPGHFWHHVMTEINTAAKTSGRLAVDGPYARLKDDRGFEESVRLAALMGYDGKWAIHPSQIEPINRAFTPSAEDVARAQEIVTQYAAAVEQGRGAIALDDEMVDAATLRMAEQVLEKARSAAGS